MAKNLTILLGALLLAVAACGGGGGDGDDGGSSGGDSPAVAVGAGDAANGEKVYEATCVACHGPNGEGIEGLGKPMPGSPFITGLSDADLITFIKEGRGPSHPDNTTGVDMPPKGGNPALDDQDLADVVAFIRTLG